MGIIGKIIGIASGFLPFKKGGAVKRRRMATGGMVLDAADKQAIANLANKSATMKRGGRVSKRK